MRSLTSYLVLIFVLLSTLAASAQPPTSQLVPFNGSIAGQPDGDVDLRLRLFPASSGGAFCYEETQTVTVAGETFSAVLGLAPLGGPLGSCFSGNASLFVAVALDSTPDMEIGPRTPLYSAGYAFRATNADQAANAGQLGGILPGGFVQTTGGSISGSNSVSALTVMNTNPSSGSGITATGSSASGAGGLFMNALGDLIQGKRNASDPAPVFRLFNNGGAFFAGSVGIGTTRPAAKLQVLGGDVFIGNVINPAYPGSGSLYFANGGGPFIGDPQNSFRMNAGRPGTPEDNLFIVGYSGPGARVGAGIQFLTGPAGQGQVPRMAITPDGNVGIGTQAPDARLSVVSSGPVSQGNNTAVFYAPNIGPWFSHIHYGLNGDWVIRSAKPEGKVVLQDSGGNVGIGTFNPAAKLHVVGRTMTGVLQITGGSDLSEQFEVRGTPKVGRGAAPEPVEPGLVVSIDPDHPGKLAVSTEAYDRRVAGILSGAGGVKPGMLMGQSGSVANGDHPVALTGRVYCWADAAYGPIEPGDRLTTSDTPGHAMKVTDHGKAQGAIIGKAMTGLKAGKGLVLVLVMPQ